MQNNPFDALYPAFSRVLDKLLPAVTLPRFARVSQRFPRPRVKNVRAVVREQLQRPGCLDAVRPGMRIGVCAGSRGIANLPLLLAELVGALRDKGAEPFIVPSMGSHGGATAEGQTALLAELGVTEAACGAPVVSDMRTVILGRTANGHTVFLDAALAAADGIIPVVRVKPHTCFRAPYESGFVKMLAIGLGKHDAALAAHECPFEHFGARILETASFILDAAPVLFGLGTIENARHETARVMAVPGGRILEEEPEYLREAFSLMATIYFEPLDVLVVEKIGKDISGEGMDPNITGTYHTRCAGEGFQAACRVVLGLTEETRGSGVGIGMVDFTTLSVLRGLDLVPMYTNALSARAPKLVRLPLVMPDAKQAILAAQYASRHDPVAGPRIVIIRNTADIDSILVSEALWAEAEAHPQTSVDKKDLSLAFDRDGNLAAAR
jgi:hypothetical protein